VGDAIAEVLPYAVGIAISPVPIIAAILMLLSPRARSTGVGFLVGWAVGIAVAVTVFTLLSSLIPKPASGSSQPVVGTIKLLLGAGLLLLAVRQWRSRPKPGQEASLPAWMGAIDSMTTLRGLLLAFALAAVNPKNLLLAAAAGVSLGAAGLTAGATAGAIAVFTLIATLSVALPVVAYLVASDRMRGPLQRLRAWLVQNNTAVMAVLLLVIGVVLIRDGIQAF
jgi:threonine/homoserine/homoserine lactone efflux protein